MKIPVDKIRDIIGPGGKIIREICEETGAKIDIEEDGTVKVAAVSGPSGEAAVARIRDIVAEPELGVIYDGKVVKTVDFGAFVNFLGAKMGWCIFLNCKMAAPKRPRIFAKKAIWSRSRSLALMIAVKSNCR